ncbi:hypothetical protein NLI96_g10977 [Meripilus lineatus]|uniref:Uncharacterized protein n=1 Tax=Meripilus lineatus TaxID=2056292 RepID=A0AAD5Y8T7_9APHY|nr:hypothetical protein NLI96_g10977 [Physisporinus lineatus]
MRHPVQEVPTSGAILSAEGFQADVCLRPDLVILGDEELGLGLAKEDDVKWDSSDRAKSAGPVVTTTSVQSPGGRARMLMDGIGQMVETIEPFDVFIGQISPEVVRNILHNL